MNRFEVRNVELPEKLLQDINGFAVHYESDMLKIVYKAKEDEDFLCKDKEEGISGNLRLILFEKPDMETVVEYLQEKCDITRIDDTLPVIYSTGTDTCNVADKLSQSLNIRLKNVPELDCLVSSFNYLARYMPIKEMICSLSEEDFVEMERMKEANVYFTKLLKSIEGKSQFPYPEVESMDWGGVIKKILPTSMDFPLTHVLDDMYPCLLVILGSDYRFVEVHADGSYKLRNILPSAGCILQAAGSVVAGQTISHRELIDLAETGKYRNVDVTLGDNAVKSAAYKKKDFYSGAFENPVKTDHVIFCFGKAAKISKECFKKEDLASALVHSPIMSLCGIIMDMVRFKNFKHVFLAGSLVDSEVLRREFVVEFVRRRTAVGFFNDGKGMATQLHFIKAGVPLGAIGALMNNCLAS